MIDIGQIFYLQCPALAYRSERLKLGHKVNALKDHVYTSEGTVLMQSS